MCVMYYYGDVGLLFGGILLLLLIDIVGGEYCIIVVMECLLCLVVNLGVQYVLMMSYSFGGRYFVVCIVVIVVD